MPYSGPGPTPPAPGYPWPTIGNDATNYWVGRDGYFYALDEDDGSIVWTWDPRGCGVTNIPPVTNGKVFIEADTATDYHYGYFATLDAETRGRGLASRHYTTGPGRNTGHLG